MLKGIDQLLSGALLRELDELGHGEAVALVDVLLVTGVVAPGVSV